MKLLPTILNLFIALLFSFLSYAPPVFVSLAPSSPGHGKERNWESHFRPTRVFLYVGSHVCGGDVKNTLLCSKSSSTLMD